MNPESSSNPTATGPTAWPTDVDRGGWSIPKSVRNASVLVFTETMDLPSNPSRSTLFHSSPFF